MSLFYKTKHFLLRPKNVVLLIALITLSIVISSVMPQRGFRGEEYFETLSNRHPVFTDAITFLQLDQVYSSVWFLCLIGILWLTLIITSWDQSRALFNHIKSHEQKLPLHFYMAKSGVFLFHLSLVLIVTTAIYGLAFFQRGYVKLIEGETFEASKGSWSETTVGFFANKMTLDFNIILTRFKVDYWKNNEEKSLSSNLLLENQDSEKPVNAQLNLSEPFEYNDVTLYQGNEFGYSLTYVLSSNKKRPVATHFLLNATGKKYEAVKGKNDFPTTPFIFDIRFWPDVTTPSYFLNNPGVDLEVSDKGKNLFTGRMLLGDSVTLTEELTLHFFDTRYWTRIIVARNYGIPLLYTGFLLATIGVVLMYWPYPDNRENKINTGIT